MVGSVWEQCQDWYGEDYYSNTSVSTPKSPKQAKNEYCKAVLGTILPTAYGSLIASMSGTLGFRCVADILLINMLTYREFLVTLDRFSSVYGEAYENYDPQKIC